MQFGSRYSWESDEKERRAPPWGLLLGKGLPPAPFRNDVGGYVSVLVEPQERRVVSLMTDHSGCGWVTKLNETCERLRVTKRVKGSVYTAVKDH
jgi:hypothetical protein